MLLLLIVGAVAAYLTWFYAHVRRYPKGPTPWPVVGNLFQMRREDPHEHQYELSQKYGSVFTLFLPKPVVFLSSYEDIKESLHVNIATELLTYVNEGGIIFSNGDNWREQRRLALTIMRNFGMGKNIMEQQIQTSIADMLEYMEGLKDKSKVDMFVPLQLCVGNVINETLFGTIFKHSDSEKFFEFVEILTGLFEAFRTWHMGLMLGIPAAKYVPPCSTVYAQHKATMGRVSRTACERCSLEGFQYFDFIVKQVRDQVKTFDADQPPSNFVQAYLHEKHKGDNPYLTEDQLISLASDFWIAGMETTSTTLRWAIMYMLKWPEVQKKAQVEIDRVVGRDRSPSMADKPSMPYMTAVVTEVQRLASIVNIMHHSRAISYAHLLGGGFSLS
ncbi:Protein CYP-14A2 [Aphelenchoides avenae]|nr:Protein CYP-14A2 [Aphelenchus avenae]